MENVVFQEHPEMPIHFDQLIVNQYEPGQGIESHIDKPALFEGIIASISLGSDCFMEFQKEKEQPQ